MSREVGFGRNVELIFCCASLTFRGRLCLPNLVEFSWNEFTVIVLFAFFSLYVWGFTPISSYYWKHLGSQSIQPAFLDI